MKLKISVAFAAILLLIAIVFLTPRGSPLAVRSADGRVVRVEAWNFKPAPVPYDLPYHPWAKRLDKVLPNWLKQRLHLSQPLITSVAMPNFRGESFLSAAFSIHNAQGAREVVALRLVVSDDHGQEFDPAVQDANVYAQQGTQYWADEVKAFPRRGRELRLHLVTETQTLAQIAIPNPAPGPHPRWKAEKLPVKAGDSGLEFSLVKFRCFQPGAATFTKVGVYPRAQCSFRVQEKGRRSVAWRPVSFEISDATGNHWKPWLDSSSSLNGDEITGGFLGALWPEEDAWKLRVEFKRVGEFAENELVRMVKLPIPGPEEIMHPQISCETNDTRVGVVAVIGAKAPWEQIYQFNPDRVGGCVTVLINGRIRSQGRRLVFIEAKDEFGNTVKLEGPASEPGQLSGQSPDYLPYSFNFRPAQNAHELTLVLAASQQRVVEFLAKPDQVREDSGAPP